MKKILLVTQYFYPENFKSNDIAFDLVKRGYDVTVLTAIPNYPQGTFFDGYGIFKKRKETINGVKVIRTLLFPRGKGGGLSLALNFFSWAFFASFRGVILALFNKYDVVLGHEPSPITQGIPCVIIKKLLNIPLYFWVLDLWPESLISAGNVTNPKVISFFTKITNFVYRNSDKILISSRGFEKSIVEKGDYKKKIVYFPNWGEDLFLKKTAYKTPLLPKGFKVMFAGNIGEAQDFDSIMSAALKLKERKDIHWIFVGDGRKRAWMESFVKENKLQETVHWVGRHPLEAMPAFFEQADVMLVTLKDELIFNLTVPAKLQAYMAASKPILAMLNGEGAAVIKEADCGFSANAGDFDGLAKLVEECCLLESLPSKGVNGFEYYKNNFSKDICMNHLCEIIK